MKSLVAKVLLWRGISIATTAVIVWLYLGDIQSATGLTIFLHAVLTALNYIFELAWKRLTNDKILGE